MKGLTDDWNNFELTAEVADVKRPLVSVSKMCEAGNRVVFDPAGSYVGNITTGKRTAMEHTGQGYKLKVWLPPFQRQVHP